MIRIVLSSGYFNSPSSGGIIDFPVNTPGFEMPRPLASSGKTSYVTLPVHSTNNFRVFIMELECEYPYDLVKSNLSVSTPENYFVQNKITFGPAFSATNTSNIAAKASNEILILSDCLLTSDNEFVAKIETMTCPEINNLASRSVISSTGSRVKGDTETLVDVVSIYPNPNTGIFNIESRTNASVANVVITRIDKAQKIFESKFNGVQKVAVDIAKETSGLYTVQVYLSDGQIFTKNIIKE
jgi:hypothetical protein